MLIEMFCQHFYLKCVEIRFYYKLHGCSNFVARIIPALTTMQATHMYAARTYFYILPASFFEVLIV
jgi:hypothetical protein